MQTRAAVVAEVGEVVNVGLVKLKPLRHGGKNCAKTLAIAAGIADDHFASDFGLGRAHRIRARRPGMSGRRSALRQRLSLAGQGFKLLHDRAPR
jgi:hypothetical protein